MEYIVVMGGLSIVSFTVFAVVRCRHMSVRREFPPYDPEGPQIKVCYDLSTTARGECAICLLDVTALPKSIRSSGDGGEDAIGSASATLGLLSLPCSHVFHGECAVGWFKDQETCPTCRAPIGSMTSCVRHWPTPEALAKAQRRYSKTQQNRDSRRNSTDSANTLPQNHPSG